MTITNGLLVMVGERPAAGSCVVCGRGLGVGEGLAARFRGQALRFTWGGCLSVFAADPDRFIQGGAGERRAIPSEESPASEWTCE